MTEPRDHLLALARALAAHRGVSVAHLGTLARNDGKFFKRLADGGGCHVSTYFQVLAWFSDKWPDNLAWPADVPRPSTVKPACCSEG